MISAQILKATPTNAMVFLTHQNNCYQTHAAINFLQKLMTVSFAKIDFAKQVAITAKKLTLTAGKVITAAKKVAVTARKVTITAKKVAVTTKKVTITAQKVIISF